MTTNLWPIAAVPVTRREMLHAAERLRQMPVFRNLPGRYLRSLLRPVFAAGWSPAQVAHALDHTPAGIAYWHTEQVRSPAAWAKNRLAAWQNADGTWVTPPVRLGAGRSLDLRPDEVAALPRPSEPAAAAVAEHAGTARALLDAVRRRVTAARKPKPVGLGIILATEPAWTPGRPYDATDPRARYAAAAQQDAVRAVLGRRQASV